MAELSQVTKNFPSFFLPVKVEAISLANCCGRLFFETEEMFQVENKTLGVLEFSSSRSTWRTDSEWNLYEFYGPACVNKGHGASRILTASVTKPVMEQIQLTRINLQQSGQCQSGCN